MKMVAAAAKHLTTDAGKKPLVFAVIFLSALIMTACIAAIPIAIKYAKSANETKAKAEMPVPVDKVYSTAVDMAKEKGLEIVKENDEKHYLEVTDGVQTASLKAEAASNDKTEVIIVAKLPSQEGEEKAQRKEREKELTLRIVDRLCERLQVKCTIIEEKPKENTEENKKDNE